MVAVRSLTSASQAKIGLPLLSIAAEGFVARCTPGGSNGGQDTVPAVLLHVLCGQELSTAQLRFAFGPPAQRRSHWASTGVVQLVRVLLHCRATIFSLPPLGVYLPYASTNNNDSNHHKIRTKPPLPHPSENSHMFTQRVLVMSRPMRMARRKRSTSTTSST